MKPLMYIMLFPCVLGVEICLNGYTCSEGTFCCRTQDGKTRCCNKDNSANSIAAEPHQKAAVYSPAVHPYFFPYSSEPNIIMQTYCTSDCGLRPCCKGTCCPFIVGRCCEKSCCRSGHQCCGDVTVGEDEWCCPYDKKCSSYIKGLCVGGAMVQMSSMALMLVMSVLSILGRYSSV